MAFRYHWSSLLIALLAACIAASDSRTGAAQGSDAPPAPVVVAELIATDVAESRSFVGTAVARRLATIGSAVDGRVIEFFVESGQAVEKDEPLAQLLTNTLEIEIAAAEAELALRQAELDELENGSRPAEIAAARAARAAADIAFRYAESRFERGQQLIQTGGISQDEFDNWRSEYLRTQEVLNQVQKSLELIEEGPRQETIQQARARVESQRQAVALLEDRLQKYTIRAPFDGYVVVEHTERGAWLQQGAAVADVAEVDPLEIEAYVPQSFIRHVRSGVECTIRIDGDEGAPLKGKVHRVVPQANVQSRTFPVRIVVENPLVDGGHNLLPGMLTHVAIPLGTPASALLAPKDALRLGGSTPILVRVTDGKAEFVPVTTGRSDGERIEVRSVGDATLSEGDQVVVRGNERLRPGQPVQVPGG